MKKDQDTMNLERIYKRAHIQTFNPPYIHGADDREKDPFGWQKRAYDAVWEGDPTSFVSWLDEHHPEWPETALGNHLVGRAYKYEKQADQARHHLTTAASLRRQQQDHVGLAETLVVLSEVAIDEDKLDEAWTHLNEAVQLAPHHRSPHINRFCLASLACDEPQLTALYQELNERYPLWYEDQRLCEAFHNDGELFFLRDESQVWQQMLSLMSPSSPTSDA
jgi:tetratricopeptide (TPR) repeat protein